MCDYICMIIYIYIIWKSICHPGIGLVQGENLRETMVSTIKYGVFLCFPVKIPVKTNPMIVASPVMAITTKPVSVAWPRRTRDESTRQKFRFDRGMQSIRLRGRANFPKLRFGSHEKHWKAPELILQTTSETRKLSQPFPWCYIYMYIYIYKWW